MMKLSGRWVSSRRGATYALFADQRGDAGERDVEAAGLGQLRREESELHLAAVAGFGFEVEAEDAGRRRVRCEIELQQLEQNLALRDGERGLEGAGVFAAAIETEREGEAGEGVGAILRAG